MNEIIAIVLMMAGSMFLVLAAVGVLRMPDIFMRIQVSAKASTLGCGGILLGVAIHFGDVSIASRALLTIVFLFLTSPIAAHMIGRAAYFVGVPLWEGTIRDDLAGKYDRERHLLRSSDLPEDGTGAITEDRAEKLE